MSNFNNPNLPLGMMQQAGFTSSPQMSQQGQQHPNYSSMNQMAGGNPSGGMGGQGLMGSSAGMQFNQHQNSPGVPSTGMGANNYGHGNTASSGGSNSQQFSQQQFSQGSANNASANSTTPMDTSGSNPPSQQPQQPSKELNAASLCRFGQETVQELVSRTQEVFQTLKTAQPPDGKTGAAAALDRKPKFQETLKNIRALFKRLRVIYEKMEESFPTSEDTYFEDSLPFKDGPEVTVLDEKKNTETYQQASEEYREIMDQLLLRNRHLRDTVDHLRQIIWDVNTMLAMRKE